MVKSTKVWIYACVVLFVSPCRGSARAKPGLFDMFSGNNEDEGRSMQPSFPSIIPNSFNLLAHNSDYDDSNSQPNNQPTNINLVSLFPQTNVPVTRTGLDPETRVELTEQKEKLENILQKLQEMNKQKEEEKQRQQQGNGNNLNNVNPNVNRPVNNNNFNPNLNRPMPNKDNDNNFNPDPNRPLPNNGNNNFNPNLNRPTANPLRPGGTTSPVTEKVLPKERPAPKKIWKKLMTKKFMFQAKPVKPENEVADLNTANTLYYVVE